MKAGLLVVVLLFGLAAGLSGRGADSVRSNGGEAIAPTSTVTEHRSRPAGTARVVAAQAPARPRPAALPHATAAAPQGRKGPVVVFGVARGRRASNSALLPAAFLGATGQSTGAVPRVARPLPEQNLEAPASANAQAYSSTSSRRINLRRSARLRGEMATANSWRPAAAVRAGAQAHRVGDLPDRCKAPAFAHDPSERGSCGSRWSGLC